MKNKKNFTIIFFMIISIIRLKGQDISIIKLNSDTIKNVLNISVKIKVDTLTINLPKTNFLYSGDVSNDNVDLYFEVIEVNTVGNYTKECLDDFHGFNFKRRLSILQKGVSREYTINLAKLYSLKPNSEYLIRCYFKFSKFSPFLVNSFSSWVSFKYD